MPGERKQSSPATERYIRGMELYRHGRYEQAAAELDALVDRADPMGQVARFRKGLAHRHLGVEALQDGRFARAERHFRAAIETVGPEADLVKYLATVYARTHRYDDCSAQMERAVDCGGDDAAEWRRLAQAQWHGGGRVQARMTIAQAMRRGGPKASLHFQLGLFQAAEGQYAQAHASMMRAADGDCTNGEIHYHLALTSAALGDASAAARSFQRAFELRPHDLVGAYQLALAARAAAEDGCRLVVRLPEPPARTARTETRQLAGYVTREPDFVESFLLLPPSDVDADLFGVLAKVVEVALAEHGDYADLRRIASRLHERLGHADRAMAHARQAVRINPTYVKGLVHLARLTARAGRADEAVSLLERAIACGGDWPDIHCFAAELMMRLNAAGAAREHLTRALQLNASYPRATRALAAMAA